MKKKWLRTYNSILVALLALTGTSCSTHRHVSSPKCIYGPPTEFEREVVPERKVIYGPPPAEFKEIETQQDEVSPNNPNDNAKENKK